MNRRELASCASTAVRLIFSSSDESTCTAFGAKPNPRHQAAHFAGAQFEIMMMMQFDKSTRRSVTQR